MWRSDSKAALETFLSSYHNETDPDTTKALQSFLNAHWDVAGFRKEPLGVDGVPNSPATVMALQTFLLKHRLDSCPEP